MPVSIRVQDGPPQATWMSPAITPMTTSTPPAAVVGNLTANATYDFDVAVQNVGDVDAVPALLVGGVLGAPAPTGPFTLPAVAAAGGGATLLMTTGAGPGGWQVAFDQATRTVTVSDAGGSTRLSQGVGAASPAWGFSPDGRFFVLGLSHAVTAGYAKYDLTFLPTRTLSRSGKTLTAWQAVPGSFTVGYPAAGGGWPPPKVPFTWGFPSAGGDLFCVAYDDTPQTRQVEVFDLRPDATDRRPALPSGIGSGSKDGRARVLLAPTGELVAILGTPNTTDDDARLLAFPEMREFEATTKGTKLGACTVSSPAASLTLQRPRELDGIAVNGLVAANGTSVTRIDPPHAAISAVEVHLYVSPPTVAPVPATAVEYPVGIGTAGTGGRLKTTAGAWVGRLAAGSGGIARVLAGFKADAVAQGGSVHRCAVAEAFTVPGVPSGDPRRRPANDFQILSPAHEQTAQRNLIIVGPNTPYFLAPFIVQNPSERAGTVEVRVAPTPLATLAGDPAVDALMSLDPATLEIARHGLFRHDCSRLRGPDEIALEEGLVIDLAPEEAVPLAALLIAAAEPSTLPLSAAAFHVSETRDGTIRTGITIIAVTDPSVLQPVPEARTPHPTPVALAGSPVLSRSRLREDAADDGTWICATFRVTGRPLRETTLYLESLGAPHGAVESRVYTTRWLGRRETFTCAFPCDLSATPEGEHRVSFVAESYGYEPVRLISSLTRRLPRG